MALVDNEISNYINECFKVAVISQKEKTSLAGEAVKVKFKKISLANNEIKVDCEIRGISGELYEEYQLRFDSISHPFYYLEVLRLALITKWSGNRITEKDKKRYLFILEYGSDNRYYLNRSLKYLYYMKKLLRIQG